MGLGTNIDNSRLCPIWSASPNSMAIASKSHHADRASDSHLKLLQTVAPLTPRSINPRSIMTRLTLRIDETLLRKARIIAKENGTSVNAIIREFIEKTANDAAPERISAERLMQLIEQSRFASTGERLTRDEPLGG